MQRPAEARAQGQVFTFPANIDNLAPEDARQLLHKLRVYQIELAMQNDELRRAQTELDGARSRYFDLYDLAPVGYLTLGGIGLIDQANLTAATLLGLTNSALIGQLISRFISHEDQDIDESAQSPELRLVLMDISERKRVDEELREQEGLFHLIAENIGDFITVLDLEGRRIYNSSSYARLFGTSRASAVRIPLRA